MTDKWPTDAMIAAGMVEVFKVGPDLPYDVLASHARAIYLAMEAARPSRGCRGQTSWVGSDGLIYMLNDEGKAMAPTCAEDFEHPLAGKPAP